MLKSFFLTCLLLTGLSSVAQAAPQDPVFGYVERSKHFVVTLDGAPTLRFKTSRHSGSPSRLELIEFVRELNTIAQLPHYSAHQIQPALQGGHYQIRYGDRVLLQFDEDWQPQGQSSRLKAVLKLTQSLRNKLGAPQQQVFKYLNAAVADQTGMASWYGGHFHGRLTANGERYDVNLLTAAHKKLPFGTRVLVTNIETGQSVVVKINDRGPFKPQRIIDLSPKAFEKIGYLGQGVLKVKLTVLSQQG